MAKIVASISGGMDSFCFTAKYRKEGDEIYPILFHYGQKALQEIVIAKTLCSLLGFHEPKIVDLYSVAQLWEGTQLVDRGVDVEGEYTKSVVVPLRNAVFLTLATTYAHLVEADGIIYGAHMGDVGDLEHPDYPDCTPTFATALAGALAKGSLGKAKIPITSPAAHGMYKRDLIKMGYEAYGGLIFKTWSCYKSDGKQCGECESCRNRKKAFAEAEIEDLTEYLV